jgi:hypothetical protein
MGVSTPWPVNWSAPMATNQARRWSAEGDAASEELNSIEENTRALETAAEELRQFVFLLSDNPDFAEVMSEDHGPTEPLPRTSPSREETMAIPRRSGAPPYPFLKRPDDD